MGLGFSFEETMSGSYYLLDAPLAERAISFSIGARVDGMRQFLRDKTARIEGHVSVEGLAERCPLSGTLGLKLFAERRLPYLFTFRGDDGHEYRLQGQKDVTMIALLDTLTTLPASLYDAAGREIGRSVLRFDARQDLTRFLRSWKPRIGSWIA
jgi:hypothetical protein